MGNTLWSRLNNKSKNKKTAYEISKETNIPEEKVKEVLNGERQLPNDRVDSFTNAIQKDNKVEKTLNMLTIKKWYKETDLKQARLNLGYTTQISLAKALNINPSTINRLENRSEKSMSDELLMKYYDFLNDELNKVIDVPKRNYKKKKKLTDEEKERIRDVDLKEVLDWWHTFNLREYLDKNNLSHKELANAIGYNSGSTICDLVNMTRSEYSLRNVITRLYLYINGLNKGANKKNLEENDKLVEETKNESNNPIYTGYYQILDDKNKDSIDWGTVITTTNNGTSYIVEDVYNEDPFEEYVPKHSTENISVSKEGCREMDLELQVKELKEEVERYKKIIDRLLKE